MCNQKICMCFFSKLNNDLFLIFIKNIFMAPNEAAGWPEDTVNVH